jgi:hypothetical protein
MKFRWLLPLLLCSANASADWARDSAGCRIFVPDYLEHASFSWHGRCLDGEANGIGALRMAGFEFRGEFKGGRPIRGEGSHVVIETGGTRDLRRLSLANGEFVEAPISAPTGGHRVPIDPVMGHWKLEFKDDACQDFIEYRRTHEASVVGTTGRADAVVQLYELADQPGWLALSTTTFTDDRSEDCRGARVEAGKPELVFLKREEGHLKFCVSASNDSCFATATKLTADVWGSQRSALRPRRYLISSAAGHGINHVERNASPDRFARSPPVTGPEGQDREEIELAFDRSKGALYALYGRALRDNPKLQGKMVARLTIIETGEAGGCTIVSSELGDPLLERKLCARMNLIRFKARAKPITIEKPLEFFPAD